MKRGFGLMDVILATAVLLMVGLFLLNLFPSSLLAISTTRNRLHAQNYCQSQIAALRHAGFSSLEFGQTEYEAVSDGTHFLVTTEITPVAGRDEDLIRAVKVTARWNVGKQQREESLETYLSAVRR
jgi:hypothetical protein